MSDPIQLESDMSISHVAEIKPRIVDVDGGCRYLGGLSRARFYELLPSLVKVKIGHRTFVTVESLDRLIDAGTEPF